MYSSGRGPWGTWAVHGAVNAPWVGPWLTPWGPSAVLPLGAWRWGMALGASAFRVERDAEVPCASSSVSHGVMRKGRCVPAGDPAVEAAAAAAVQAAAPAPAPVVAPPPDLTEEQKAALNAPFVVTQGDGEVRQEGNALVLLEGGQRVGFIQVEEGP